MLRLVPLLGLLSAAIAAQHNGGTPAPAPAPAPVEQPRAQPAEQPVVWLMGASLTAGFVDPLPRTDGERNETVRLQRVLEKIWPEGAVDLRSRSSAMLPMFMGAERLGKQQVEHGLEAKPTLVVALDFLFWYGYGGVRVPEGSSEEAVRLARLETGLQELGRFGCPILVGDFPDMHGADPRMLPPRSIPSEETLAKLNERVRGWIAERPTVRLLQLSEFVQKAKGDGLPLQLEGKQHVVGPRELLQGDRLHPTILGMAMVGRHVVEALRELLPEEHTLRPAPVEVAELAEDLGAEPALDELRRRAKNAADKDAKPAGVPVKKG